MANQSEKIKLLLIQKQGVFGTAETDVAAADVIETIGPATIKLNPNGTEVDLVAGALSQDGFVPGAADLDLAFKVYCVGAGSDAPGQYGTLLELAGLVKSEVVDGTFTYAFTSAQASLADFTAWLYSGNLNTSGSVLRKAYNGLIIPKWTFAAGKPTIFDCTSKMGYGGIPAAATSPSITKQATIPPAFFATAALSIVGDSDYQIISGEIDGGQTAALTLDPSDTYGNGLSVLTDRKIKWKFKVYQDIPSVVDPETALTGKTQGALTITYGTVPQKLSWSLATAQIIDIDHDDEGGVSTWTLSGISAANAFAHSIQTKA